MVINIFRLLSVLIASLMWGQVPAVAQEFWAPIAGDLLATVSSDASSFAGQQTPIFIVKGAGGEIIKFAVDMADGRRFYTPEQLRVPVAIVSHSRGFITKHILLLHAPALNPQEGGGLSVIVLRQYGVFNDDYRVYDLLLARDQAAPQTWRLWRQHAQENSVDALDSIFFGVRAVNNEEVGIERIFARNGNRQVEDLNTSDLQRSLYEPDPFPCCDYP